MGQGYRQRGGQAISPVVPGAHLRVPPGHCAGISQEELKVDGNKDIHPANSRALGMFPNMDFATFPDPTDSGAEEFTC